MALTMGRDMDKWTNQMRVHAQPAASGSSSSSVSLKALATTSSWKKGTVGLSLAVLATFSKAVCTSTPVWPTSRKTSFCGGW